MTVESASRTVRIHLSEANPISHGAKSRDPFEECMTQAGSWTTQKKPVETDNEC
jgi:hypothetical protein